MLRSYITVRGQYEGMHEWEAAPEEVAFLRSPHRHIFKWEVTLEVFHDDRELEFFLVQRRIKEEFQYRSNLHNGESLGSCEQQALYMVDMLQKLYGDNRYIKVTVSEDGENGGTFEWNPHSVNSGTSRNGQDDHWKQVGLTAGD